MKRLYAWVSVFACICVVIANISCNNNKSASQKIQFYYYPEKNVYYNVAKGSYIYSIDGAKTWTSVQAKLEENPDVLGRREVIYANSDSVWKENDAHRKLFGGSLLDVVAEDTATDAGTDVKERKAIKKAVKHKTVSKVDEDERKKRPIKDFFKKIFGKRKKKDSETPESQR